MININKKELDNLKPDFVGGFGSLYIKGDKVLKIYKEEVKTDKFGVMAANPLLKKRGFTINKCKRLMILNDMVHYTDLVEDLVYIDGKFYGVVMPYYEGQTLYDLRNDSFENRLNYSHQLVRNAKELTDVGIYPLDYKLDNIIKVDDDIKIVDLDDVKTKVSLLNNYFLQRKSIAALDETIKSLLKEKSFSRLDLLIDNLVDYEKTPINKTYDSINDYLSSKSRKENLLFISEDYKSYMDKVRMYKIIFTFDTFDQYEIIRQISLLREKGVIVNDVIHKDEIENYMDNSMYRECVLVEKSKVLKLR